MSLWDLFSIDAERMYKTWNVTIRNVFSLDRKTHRRLIEPLSGCCHLKTALLSRYVKFYNSLRGNKKFSLRYLARVTSGNLNSKMGRTISNISHELNINMSEIHEVSSKCIKRNLIYMKNENEWEINLGGELILARKSIHRTIDIPGFSDDEIQMMLDTLCRD